MTRDSLQGVVHHLHQLVGPGPAEETTDAALLARYVRHRDPAAFEALVVRHGPMVLRLCRRLLRQAADCEDAFQATFLTLARKAPSIRSKNSLAGWLYRVAYRVACRARARTVPSEPMAVEDLPAPERESDFLWRDLRPVLDAEIAQLSEAHRRVLVLCDLEGMTHEEAARHLGCPKGTVASYLARARQRLQRRLSGRGWTLPAGLLGTALAEEARAASVPAEWVKAAAGSATPSARAVGLCEGVMRIMWLDNLKVAAGILAVVLLSGVGVAVWPSWAQDGPESAKAHQDVAGTGAAPAAAQEKPRDDTAALRSEIADLRRELETAVKEIRALKQSMRENAPAGEPERLYKGKTLSFWLSQARDADPEFRAEAMPALGAIGKKNQEAIASVMDALKDENQSVSPTSLARAAMNAAYQMRDADMIPALSALLNDRTSTAGRRNAAHLLGFFGPRAKVVTPQLIEALKDENVRVNAVHALGAIGPDARAAIPALLELFDQTVRTLPADAPKKPRGGREKELFRERFLIDELLSALERIDPANEQAIGKSPTAEQEVGFRLVTDAELQYWRQANEALRKKYGK